MQPSINLPTSDIERIPGVAHFLILCNCNGGPSLMKPLATQILITVGLQKASRLKLHGLIHFFFGGGGRVLRPLNCYLNLTNGHASFQCHTVCKRGFGNGPGFQPFFW